MMAWVTLEDLAGTIELVVFPRTWEKYQFALEIGGVILAEGKVDAQSSPSKVLVDNIRTEIKLTEPAQNAAGATAPAQMVLQPQKGAPAASRSSGTTTGAEIPPQYRSWLCRLNLCRFPGMDDEPPEDPPDWENYHLAKLLSRPITWACPRSAVEQPFAVRPSTLSGSTNSGVERIPNPPCLNQ